MNSRDEAMIRNFPSARPVLPLNSRTCSATEGT